MPHARLHFFPLAVSFALVACSGSAEDSLASAKRYLAKSDLPAATIELKNALQAKPDLAEARFLFGKTLLERDDAVAAAVELRKARDLKYPEDQVVPLLAKALLGEGDPKKVAELDASATLASPQAIASMKTTVALAASAQGNREKAEAASAAALQADPNYAPALLFRARTLAEKHEMESATKAVDDVLIKAPADPDALVLKGDLLQLSKGDVNGATEQYRKALEVKPGFVPAHTSLLTLLLAKGDLDGARRQLAALKSARPKHPQTVYFEARLASQQGDLKTAEEQVQQLLKVLPDNPQVLQLAGVVALQRNELLQAEQHFGKLVQMAPSSVGSRQSLARTYLRSGQLDKALATLAPIVESPSPNVETLSLAGTAWLMSGDQRKAEELLGRALKLKPDDPANRTAFAVARLQGSSATTALDELEAIADSDPGTAADMALLSADLRQRDFDGAQKVIDRIERKQPGKSQANHLRGQVFAMQGDLTRARASYEKALAADPKFFPSIEGLARLDLRENRPEQARARFEAVLKSDPKSVAATLALASLDERLGKPKEQVAAEIASAVSLNPSDPAIRRRLVQYHLRNRDNKSALNVAQDAASAFPNDPSVLLMLAEVQKAAGDTNQAIASYNKVAAMLPKSPEPHLGLARLYVVAKNYDEAQRSLAKALQIEPTHAQANKFAVALYLFQHRDNDALALARGLQTHHAESAIGFELLGDIGMRRRKWPEAVSAYQAALKKEPSTSAVERLHAALRAGGNMDRAKSVAAGWLKEHPHDAGFLLYLGNAALVDKDNAAAETRLAEVVKLQPDNASALNNLAWALHRQRKPGALAYAERANKVTPNVPALMDTWALLLAEGNDVTRALELQKRAVALAPDMPALRLTLAKIYAKSGDKAAAQSELERLRDLGNKFGDQGEVQELLTHLQ
jgi:cellulose synthase operon protein C